MPKILQVQNASSYMVPADSSPCPGNPEKGGDGTGGKDTKEIISLLKSCKKVLEMRKRPDPYDEYFEAGDLVYDQRTEEHGVVLGEKPELNILSYQLSHKMTSRKDCPEGDTIHYIVLTITTDQESGERKTRIRYVNRHNLRRVEEHENIKSSMSDLDVFCSKQCIQECSSDCALYKYKRILDEK